MASDQFCSPALAASASVQRLMWRRIKSLWIIARPKRLCPMRHSVWHMLLGLDVDLAHCGFQIFRKHPSQSQWQSTFFHYLCQHTPFQQDAPWTLLLLCLCLVLFLYFLLLCLYVVYCILLVQHSWQAWLVAAHYLPILPPAYMYLPHRSHLMNHLQLWVAPHPHLHLDQRCHHHLHQTRLQKCPAVAARFL